MWTHDGYRTCFSTSDSVSPFPIALFYLAKAAGLSHGLARPSFCKVLLTCSSGALGGIAACGASGCPGSGVCSVLWGPARCWENKVPLWTHPAGRDSGDLWGQPAVFPNSAQPWGAGNPRDVWHDPSTRCNWADFQVLKKEASWNWTWAPKSIMCRLRKMEITSYSFVLAELTGTKKVEQKVLDELLAVKILHQKVLMT